MKFNLVVYGSLLHSNELKKHNIQRDMVQMLRVEGYKRIFNQLPSWRKVDGMEKAVLNIEEDSDFWFNAIVIKDLSIDYMRDLDKREIGYERILLNKAVTYDGEKVDNCFAYIGKTGKQSDLILPNSNYLKICLEGAKSYGEKFFEEFKKTTFQNDLKGNYIPISSLKTFVR